jgi:hypothetical protein
MQNSENFKLFNKKIHCLRKPSMIKRKPCLIYPVSTSEPNSKCYICSSQFIYISLNTKVTKLEYLIETILKKQLSLLEPLLTVGSDLVYECGEDIVGMFNLTLIKDDEKEFYDSQLTKTLESVGIEDNSVLTIEDMLQDINWRITIIHEDIEVEDAKIQGEAIIKKTQETVAKEIQNGKQGNEVEVLDNFPISLKREREELEIINQSKKKEIIDIE